MSNGTYKPRISKLFGAFLVTIAAIVDAVQIGLTAFGLVALGVILNSIISIIATIFFAMILSIKGVSFLSARRFVLTTVTLIVEIMPFANNFPMWTISTILAIKLSRREDKQKFKKEQSEAKARQKAEKKAANDNRRQQRFEKAA